MNRMDMITPRTEMCGVVIKVIKMATERGIDLEKLLRKGDFIHEFWRISLTQYLGPGDVPACPALIIYCDGPDGKDWMIMNTYEDCELSRSFKATCAELLPGLGL